MPNEIIQDKMTLGSAVTAGANIGKDAIKSSEIVHNALINNLSTGIVSEYSASINVDPTKIDITAFKAVFSPNNHTNGVAELPTEVDYAGVVGLILGDIATNSFTYVGLASNGSTTQQNTPFTTTQKKTIAPVAVAFHPNGTVLKAGADFTPATNISSQLFDLLDVIGTENISGNHIVKGTGNFNIDKEVGETLKGGANSSDLDNSNRIANALLADADIYYSYRDGSHPDGYVIAPVTSDVDLTLFDDGSGTLATVGGKKATIQRGYFLPILNIVVFEYGQVKYKDFDEASVLIPEDTSVHIRNPILDPSSLRLYLVGANDATDLDDVNSVSFRNTNGSTSTSGGDSVVLRTGLDRLDRTNEISASITNVIDPTTAKFQKINMDADLANLTYTAIPSKEGTEILIEVDWDSTAGRTFTLDISKFRGSLDIGMPQPTGVVDTRDYIHCIYNSVDQIYDIVGYTRRS